MTSGSVPVCLAGTAMRVVMPTAVWARTPGFTAAHSWRAVRRPADSQAAEEPGKVA
ncbi:hypothetical protein C5N14_30120 [Micromonospora sp. MW-13]|nr:hypothetical protein C5N14_30120 [Micromonospora sp. MW-13]